MKNSVFHFQQFTMLHHESTMPIGTDALLLGAWAPADSSVQSVLDVGCGCGVVGLIIAQRAKNAKVTFVELDKNSIQEAEKNGSNSPWSTRLHYYHGSIQEYTTSTTERFDLIVANPPYFENSLKSPVATRTQSRHTDTLPFEELLDVVTVLLSEQGKFSMVLPYSSSIRIEELAKKRHLFVTEKYIVLPTIKKEPNRVLLLIERVPRNLKEDTLILRNENNEYTQAYKELTKHFHKKI